MNEFDNDLKKSLAENGPFDPEKARGMKKHVAAKYNGWLSKIERYLYIWLIGLAALLVFAAFRLLESTSTKALVVYAMMFLVALVGQTLIKLWYWIMNSKIGTLKELKLLRLDVAAIPGADKALSRMDVDELMAGPPRRIPGCGKVERIAWKIALYAVIIFVAFASGCEFRIGRFNIGRSQAAAQPLPRMEEAREPSQATLFEGNINAVSADREAVVLIVPTNEADKAVQEQIREYVEAIGERFFKGASILTDEEALKRNLAPNALFVYGTPTGNRWLAKHWDKLPISIEPDKIVAQEIHEGANLRCITAWPNPQNPAMGVAIYTAQRAEDMVGINGVFHGPTDYVVARGTDRLEEDFYEKRDGEWSLYDDESEEEEGIELAETAIPIDVRIDPRVELISIIFRLAGNREYSMCRIPSYNQDIEEHFGPYKDHPAIKFASELRQRRGVSYDAPMSLAVHLTDATGLGEKVPFDSPDEEIDARWKLDELREFVEKARQFVKDADFNGFIDAHEELYDTTVARAKQMLRREAHFEWFDDFFGARPGANFNVIIGIVNGPSNYGARTKLGNDEELYCILGVWNCDLKGIPRFPSGMVSTVVHEFCHSYVNPLVYAHTSELEEAGTRMYETVKNTMKQMAYGNWTTMMHESVVRASGVRYTLSTRGKFAANMQIMGQVNRGFLWTRELSALLGEYEANRDQYPTLESFFPRIITFFNEYAEKIAT